MHVDTPLISTIIGGIVLAFIFGTIAQRLRLPPLVGYLMAGVVAGPFTPGVVADQSLAPQLAELGVILLMFGVGLHFSMKELLAVKAIAIPGAIGQIALATLMGMGLAWLLGWDWGPGLYSAWRSRWRARWCCSRRWKIAVSTPRTKATSPSAG